MCLGCFQGGREDTGGFIAGVKRDEVEEAGIEEGEKEDDKEEGEEAEGEEEEGEEEKGGREEDVTAGEGAAESGVDPASDAEGT